MNQRSAPMNVQDIQPRVQAFGAAEAAVLLVYLFGSQASGRAGPGSDYDLGVLLDRREDSPAGRARLTHELVVILGTSAVDVVFLNQAPPELAFAVIQGQLIYERDLAARVEYEAYAMGRYYDYLPYLRAQRTEILKGGDHAARVQRYREALGRTEKTLAEIRAAQDGKSDLQRLRNMKDEEIDYSDIPELDEAFFEKAVIVLPQTKASVSIRLDQEVLDWFKSQGKGYQTRINALLRAYMEAQTKG